MTPLFNFFRKKHPALSDYSAVGVDMHSHLLPGLDDGAQNIDESLNLIRGLHKLGFRKFYCTPHIMSDFYKNHPGTINPALEILREAVVSEKLEVEIHAAAEYYIDDGFVKKLESDRLLTIGDNYLLFEVSYINAPENIDQIIFKMQLLGYKPIMAHPERYPFWYKDFDRFQRFRDAGVLLQININSLSGYYGPDARHFALKMAHSDMIDLIGTDCHHERHLEGLKRGLSEPLMKKITEGNLLNKNL